MEKLKDLIKKYFWPYKKYIALISGIQIVSSIFAVLQPAILATVITLFIDYSNFSFNDFSTSQNNNGNIFDLNNAGLIVLDYLNSIFYLEALPIENTVVLFLGLFLLLVFLSNLFDYIAGIFKILYTTELSSKIRYNLFNKYFSFNLNFFNNKSSGDSVARVLNDANITAYGIGHVSSEALKNTFLLIFYFLYLVNTSLYISLVCILIGLIYYIATAILIKPIKATNKAIFTSNAELSGKFYEIFSNIKIIFTYGIKQKFLQKIKTNIDNYKNVDRKFNFISSIESPLKGFIDNLSLIIIVAASSLAIFNGSISPQGAVMYVVVGKIFLNPLNNFSKIFTQLTKINSSYDAIFKTFLIQSDINKPGKGLKLGSIKDFKIENLEFSYGDKKILKDINIAINLDLKKVAIVGLSGSGKSTLIDLLIKNHDEFKGTIKLNGNNLQDYEDKSYRKLFGVVTQKNLFFDDTIYNNITLFRDDFSQAQFDEAVNLSNSGNFINDSENKEHTRIGENGIKLSVGQLQRLAIARAILLDPEILVLDEATSSLDNQNEKEILNKLFLNRKRSIIFITHKIENIKNFDQIIVMHNGKIESSGTHDYLIGSSNIYNFLSKEYEDENKLSSGL